MDEIPESQKMNLFRRDHATNVVDDTPVEGERLGKDRKKSGLSAEAFVKPAMSQLMLIRLETRDADARFEYPNAG